MIELKGKYNEAKIFTDVVDEASISQVLLLLNQEFVSGSRIRLMPDIHAGAGCTIGTTMTITDKIVPNLVGVDIGCGMETIRIKEKHTELQKLDKLIYEKIPSGFNVREKTHRYFDEINLEDLFCYKHIDPRRAEKSLGTLGGGNHFIEADKDDEGNIYVVVHSGSRHLGLEVANYYQEEGYKSLNGSTKQDIDALIADLKAQGKESDIQKSIAADYSAWVAIIMGVVTGACGGVFRDILLNQEPLLFKKDLYATACLIGGLVYCGVIMLGGSVPLQGMACAVTVIIMRMLAVRYSWSLPVMKSHDQIN